MTQQQLDHQNLDALFQTGDVFLIERKEFDASGKEKKRQATGLKKGVSLQQAINAWAADPNDNTRHDNTRHDNTRHDNARS